MGLLDYQQGSMNTANRPIPVIGHQHAQDLFILAMFCCWFRYCRICAEVTMDHASVLHMVQVYKTKGLSPIMYVMLE